MSDRQLGGVAAIILAAGVLACSAPNGGESAALQAAVKTDECGPPFLVADLAPGASSTDIQSMAHVGETLAFTVAGGGNGFSLWSSDGTAAGTVMIHDTFNGGPFRLTTAGGRIYFSADQDGSRGFEPWVSDGTSAGTVLLKDINPGPDPSHPFGFVERDGKVYFALGAAGIRGQLWVTDGTEVGTNMVTNIDATGGAFVAIGGALVAVPGGNLFFFGNDGIHGFEPWTTDGTAAGTRMLGDIRPGPGDSVTVWAAAAGGSFYFVADDGAHGQEVWKSDATGTLTGLLVDLVPGPGSSFPAVPKALGDRLLFVANDGVSGREPWVSDGTAAGTHVVDINPGADSSSPAAVTVAENRFYTAARESAHGRELWVSDGTESHLVKDIVPGPTGAFSGDPNDFYAVEKSVVFDISDRVNGDELWWSAGNANKTQFADIAPGPGSSSPFLFQRAGSLLYFTADDGGAFGRELRALPVACVIKGLPAQ